MTQVAALCFKIALYGPTIKPSKDTVMNGFDLCGRNEVMVTARKCKRWGRVTSILTYQAALILQFLSNPNEGNLREGVDFANVKF